MAACGSMFGRQVFRLLSLQRLKVPQLLPVSCVCVLERRLLSAWLLRRVPSHTCIWQTVSRNFASSIATGSEVEEHDEPDALYKKMDIEVKGHDVAVLNSYEKFVTMAAKELDVNISNISKPPKVIWRRTLLKSVHIYKKHRVQYETRTHFRLIEIKHITGSTADTFLEYIQRNLPEGVAMKVTKHQIEPLPDHIKPPTEDTEASPS